MFLFLCVCVCGRGGGGTSPQAFLTISTTLCYAALDDLLLTFKPYFVYLEGKQAAVLTAGQLRSCYMHYGQVVGREYVIESHLCAFGRYMSLFT